MQLHYKRCNPMKKKMVKIAEGIFILEELLQMFSHRGLIISFNRNTESVTFEKRHLIILHSFVKFPRLEPPYIELLSL